VKLSVIIPTYNEEHALRPTLQRLNDLSGIVEIIVADGASIDLTCTIAEIEGAVLVHCGRAQRALQMNTGAALAKGDSLLFLHADTVINDVHINKIHASMENDVVGGAFKRRFDSRSPFLMLTCLIADLRGLMNGYYYGDQAIFCRKDIFNKLDGYANMDAFEDLEFSLTLKGSGKTVFLGPPILSSARRFKKTRRYQAIILRFGRHLEVYPGKEEDSGQGEVKVSGFSNQ